MLPRDGSVDAKPQANDPQVLVLLATYNGAQWLGDLLDSVQGQHGVRVSILAGDDGSSDRTLAMLHQHAAAGHDLRLLPPPQLRGGGACANFLRLLREAPLHEAFDAVALADQDDLWLPDRLARALASLASAGATGYSSEAMAFWPDGRQRPLGKAGPQRKYDHVFEPAGPGCTYVLSMPLARRLQQEFRHQPARFDGIGYHDWLIYAYARSHGEPWLIDRYAGVMYRQHGSNELGANFGLAGVNRRWGRLTSGWFRAQVLQIGRLWPGPHDTVLASLARLHLRDRIALAWRARDLRRRPRDQLALAVMLLIAVLR